MRSLLDFFALNAVLALLLAVAVGAAGLLIRAPWFANRAWLIVMLKLVTPPLLAIPVLWWQAPPPENATLPENVAPGEEPVGSLTPDEVAAILAEIGSEPTPAELPEIAPAAVEEAAPFPWEAFLAGGLLAGSVAWWALIAVRIQRFRSTLGRVGGARPAPEEVLALGREVARSLRLRKMPQLEMVDADWSPMLWVLGRTPRVIFPRKLWDALDADQRRAVLAHEFAHYARKDHWVRRLELVVLGLYWWLPVAWLARQQLRRAEEACCDQLVIASLPDHASKYAEALVETAVYVSKPRLVPLASGGATNVRNLKRRLQMIFQPRFLSRTQKAAVGLFLTLGLLALPFGFVAGQDKTVPQGEDTVKSKPKPEKPEKPEKPGKPEKTEKATKPAKRPGEGDLLNPAPGSPKAENPFANPASPSIQTLKDELELLQVQTEAKVVGLRAAERNLKIAQEISENTAKLEKQGSISRTEVLQVAKDLIKAQTDVESRQAELAEHKVRMGQLARKLETAHEKPKGASNYKEQPKPETTKPGKVESTKPAKAADPIKATPPALTADLEKLSAARAKAMQELDASAKALGDLANMTAKMAHQMETLQKQLKDSQTQLDQIREKQEEFTKLRLSKQKEAEALSAELQKLKADLDKSKLKKEKPEAK